MEKHLIFESEAEAYKIIPLNSIRKIQIAEKQYCLANTSKGYVSFQKECNHSGADLSKGNLNDFGQIVCPLHAYMFNLKTGEEDRARCKNIKVYKTVWEEGNLYVYL